jgi:hypothetical protein
MAAAQAAHTPSAAEGQEEDVGKMVNLPDVVDTVDEGKPTAYKVVRSATGKNYVEVRLMFVEHRQQQRVAAGHMLWHSATDTCKCSLLRQQLALCACPVRRKCNRRGDPG